MEWVSQVTVGKASYKSVLVALANFHHQKAGICNPSIDGIARFTELNRKTVMPALDWLKEAGLIDFEKGNRRHRIYTLNLDIHSPKNGTLKNPDKSTNLGTKKGASKVPTVGTIEAFPIVPKENSHSPKNVSPKSQPLDHEQENGNINGISPYSPPQEKNAIENRVIEYLNFQSGKKYRLTDNNRKPITARLNEGFTESDCRQVIENCTRRWKGSSQAQYLRPDTLFRPSKFEGYLNDGGEQGMPQTDQQGYDPNRTNALLAEMFPDDYPENPEPDLLPGGGEWTH